MWWWSAVSYTHLDVYKRQALEITGDNRASAAEILGLSRQSLYAKLRRYGLGELASAESEHFE